MTFPSHKPRQYYKILPDIHFVNFLTPYHVASCLTHIHQVLLLYTRYTETGRVKPSLYMSQRHLLRVQVQLPSLLNSALTGCEQQPQFQAALPPVYELDSTHAIGGWVDPSASLFWKRNFLLLLEFGTPYHPKQQTVFCP